MNCDGLTHGLNRRIGSKQSMKNTCDNLTDTRRMRFFSQELRKSIRYRISLQYIVCISYLYRTPPPFPFCLFLYIFSFYRSLPIGFFAWCPPFSHFSSTIFLGRLSLVIFCDKSTGLKTLSFYVAEKQLPSNSIT